jgi:acetylglutamate kinase
LRALLNASFGRAPVDELFTRPIARAYVEEAYRGAALIDDTTLGAYLSKFAVDAEAQGEGIGRDLWQLVTAENPTLFWRARPRNPINAWYAKQCDGLQRFKEWQVFWKGLPSPNIPAAIDYALAQPIDLP